MAHLAEEERNLRGPHPPDAESKKSAGDRRGTSFGCRRATAQRFNSKRIETRSKKYSLSKRRSGGLNQRSMYSRDRGARIGHAGKLRRRRYASEETPDAQKRLKPNLRRRAPANGSSSESEQGESLRRSIMADDSVEHFQEISKFSHYKRRRFEGAAKLLAREGVDCGGIVSKIDDEARKSPMGDIRQGAHHPSNLATSVRPFRS